MKKLILIIAILFISIPAYSADINLRFAWDHNNLADVAIWNLYSSETAGGPYTLLGAIENVPPPGIMTAPWMFVVQNNTDKVYYFVLTAVDAEGIESDYSNEIFQRIDLIPLSAPTNLTVTIEIVP